MVGVVQQKSLVNADNAAEPGQDESEAHKQAVEEVLFFMVVRVSLHRLAHVASERLKLLDYKLA